MMEYCVFLSVMLYSRCLWQLSHHKVACVQTIEYPLSLGFLSLLTQSDRAVYPCTALQCRLSGTYGQWLFYKDDMKRLHATSWFLTVRSVRQRAQNKF